MFARILALVWGRLRSAATWNVLGLVALAAACLAPTLTTGYLADDCTTSLGPGIRVYAKKDLAGWIADDIRNSTIGGRFYPLHWVTINGIFAAIEDVAAYKLYLAACVIVDVLLFVALVRKLGGDGGLASMAGGLVVLTFQLRAFFDPILSFFGLLQLVVAGALLSMLALERYLDGRGRRWLAIGAALYLASCLLYEVSYPLFVLHAWQAARRRPGWRSWLRTSLPFAASAVSCAAIAVLVRRNPVHSAVGAEFYATNFSPTAAASTMARQAFSALPLSYFTADPAGLFWGVKNLRSLASWLSQPDAMAVVLAAAAVCYLGLRRGVDRGDARGRAWLAALGALLVVLPGATIAITRKYQQLVTIGNGYVPVYIQYFGVALILATALRQLMASVPPGARAIGVRATVAVIVGLATGVTYQANRATAISLVSPPGTITYNDWAHGMGGSYHYHRRNLEFALDSGLMDDVPEHAKVFLTSEYPFWYEGMFSAFFFAKHTAKQFVTIPPSARDLNSPKAEFLRKRLAHGMVRKGPGFVVRDVCCGPQSGYVVLSREGGGGDLRLFVRQPHLFSRSRSIPGFLVAGEPSGNGGIPYLKPARELRMLKSGADWALFSLRDDSEIVAADTIRPIFDHAEATRLAEARDRSRTLQAEGHKDVISR